MAIDAVKLYSLLPYVVTDVAITVDKSATPGQPLAFQVNVVTERGKPGDHVVRLTVIDPDGNPYEPYGRNLLLTDGSLHGRLQLAFNERVGNWRLHVRDVATGMARSVPFAVVAR